MSIVERPSYTSKDVEVTSREPLFSGFIQVEKVSLRHRLFNQSEYTPVLQRELVHRPADPAGRQRAVRWLLHFRR